MKYLIILILMTTQSFACDWSKIPKQGSERLYSLECHRAVGKLVSRVNNLEAANTERQNQSEKLLATIKLKDLALDNADTRMIKWRDESYNQYSRLVKQKDIAKWNDWLYFGGGMGLALISVWAAGQISK